ncbi:MAG: hypothetical protein RIE74_06215, partial [Pseudomonadales bacterium]
MIRSTSRLSPNAGRSRIANVKPPFALVASSSIVQSVTSTFFGVAATAALIDALRSRSGATAVMSTPAHSKVLRRLSEIASIRPTNCG